MNIETISRRFFKKNIDSIADPNAKKVYENSIGYVVISAIIAFIIGISYMVASIIAGSHDYEIVGYLIFLLHPVMAVPMIITNRRTMREATRYNDETTNQILISGLKFRNKLLIFVMVMIDIAVILLFGSETFR